MSDEKSSGQSAAVTLEAGIEKLISIANKAIAGGAPTHFALAMLESNLILILRATAKAADISGEEIRSLREDNRAMLDLLREMDRKSYFTCPFCFRPGTQPSVRRSFVGEKPPHGMEGNSEVPCRLGALLAKHGRSP